MILKALGYFKLDERGPSAAGEVTQLRSLA